MDSDRASILGRRAEGSRGPCRSSAQVDGRSRGDAERPSTAPCQIPRSCGCHLRATAERHVLEGYAEPGRGASRSNNEIKRLAIDTWLDRPMIAEPQLEDPPQCVDHVRPSLLARATLAVGPRHFRDRREDPAVFSRLKYDRQFHRGAHCDQRYRTPRALKQRPLAFRSRSCGRRPERKHLPRGRAGDNGEAGSVPCEMA